MYTNTKLLPLPFISLHSGTCLAWLCLYRMSVSSIDLSFSSALIKHKQSELTAQYLFSFVSYSISCPHQYYIVYLCFVPSQYLTWYVEGRRLQSIWNWGMVFNEHKIMKTIYNNTHLKPVRWCVLHTQGQEVVRELTDGVSLWNF